MLRLLMFLIFGYIAAFAVGLLLHVPMFLIAIALGIYTALLVETTYENSTGGEKGNG